MLFCYGFRLCLSQLIYTVRPCLIHTYRAVPLPCLSESNFSRPWQGDGMLAICQLSASCCYHAQFQEICYQKHTNLRCRWPLCNEAKFVMDEKLIILVQVHECLYNLHHNDNDNSLVKDSSWKETAGELNAQDKKVSRRTQHCRRMAG
jgi:hypothetical protein